MKALTLTQPWATLMAISAKRIETRSWPTTYRGSLAIHAAKGFPDECMDLCAEEPFKTVLAAAGIYGPVDLPRGAVIAACRLIDCVRMQEMSYGLDGEPVGILGKYTEMLAMRPNEREFGDYAPGRYAWITEDMEQCAAPIHAKGALGLWNWEGR